MSRPPFEGEVAIVSACLLGVRCRYDGSDAREPGVLKALGSTRVVPVCPEELGGLGTPRPPAQLVGGDGAGVLEGSARVLIVDTGDEVTDAFVRGAQASLDTARAEGAAKAILKEGSPSCGWSRVTRDGRREAGRGVTSALLHRAGLSVEPAG